MKLRLRETSTLRSGWSRSMPVSMTQAVPLPEPVFTPPFTRWTPHVPRLALQAPAPGGGTVHQLARRTLEIASQGLTRRARLNSAGDNETGFLDPLNEIVGAGKTPAERLLDLYHGEWQGDLSRVYSEFSF